MHRTALIGIGLALALNVAAASPPGQPVTLRMAAIAPSGSEWSQELQRFGREVERDTNGRVRIKWLFGAIAGHELTALDRVARGQLDGSAGAIQCERLAPSLGALQIIGLVENEDEAEQVLEALMPLVDDDLETTPFVQLMTSMGFGHRVLFSQVPVRTMAEFRKARVGLWQADEVLRKQLTAMGIHVVPLPIEEGAKAWAEGRIDSFIAIPSAALIFGFVSHARYYTDLQSGHLPGCLLLSRERMNELESSERAVLKRSAAVLKKEFEETGRRTDEELLNKVLPEHGLKAVPMSDSFRREFLSAGRAAMSALGDKLAARDVEELVSKVLDVNRAHRRTTH